MHPSRILIPAGLALSVLCGCNGSGGNSAVAPPAGTAPSITTQPAAAMVNAPATATFSVVAVGTAPLAYQWKRNGTDIPSATSASLTTGATSAGDHGNTYSVTVSNGAGSTTSQPAALHVQWLSIQQHPANATVVAPAPATFSIAVNGNPGVFAYQWRRNGQAIPNAQGASFTTGATSVSASGASYDCTITHASGVVVSNAASLTVNPAPVAPSILQQPSPVMNLQVGQPLHLLVGAEGTQPMQFQWRKDGVDLPGAVSNPFERGAASLQDTGSYTCRVSNAAGHADSQPAIVTVSPALQAPTISAEPQDQTVLEGVPATFQATASGSTPMSCQWYRDGAPLGAATSSSCSIAAPGLTDSGARFKAVFTNAAGSATTREAVLRVLQQLSISTPSLEPAVLGTPYAQALSALGGTSPYTWRLSSGSLPTGFTLSSDGILSGTGATAGLGTFTVEVTDAAIRKATKEFTLRVRSTARMTVASWRQQRIAIANRGYDANIHIAGGTSPRNVESLGNLPAGVGVRTYPSDTSLLVRPTGNPTGVGDFTWTVRITDSEGDVLDHSFSVRVYSAATLGCDPATLPEGSAGVPYSVMLSGTGGTPPYSYLPVYESQDGPQNSFWGITLAPMGSLAGTPPVPVETTFACYVLDSAGAIGFVVRSLKIN